MPTAYFKLALIQGDMQHEAARTLAPRGFNGSWLVQYDRKTGAPERTFTVEERSIVDGKVKVNGYFNCVAKDPAVMAAIEQLQWSTAELVGELTWNRDTKYLQFVVTEVRPASV